MPLLIPVEDLAELPGNPRRGEVKAIARSLNAEGVPTSHGGRQWYAATVRAILGRTIAVADT